VDARDRAARFKETLTQQQNRPDPAAERAAAAARRPSDGPPGQLGKDGKEIKSDKDVKGDKDGLKGAKDLSEAAKELSGEGEAIAPGGRKRMTGKREEGGEPGEGGDGSGGAEALMSSKRTSEDKSEKTEAVLIAEQLAAVNVQWARPEGPGRVEAARRRDLAGPVEGANPMHKLLVGKGVNGHEARLSITTGPLAGAEIHLTHGPNGVHAVVLTEGASSRQTLASAMDEVAKRLKDKGHKLDIKMSGAGAAQREQPAEEPSLLDELTDRPRRG
jgi:hypothetical protein